jgi:hypothetical protein
MLRSIIEEDEISLAQRALDNGFRRPANLSRTANVGFQGGAVEVLVHWHNKFGIWGSFNSEPPGRVIASARKRYWNAFGTQDPSESASSLSIACEINPPHEGIYRRVAGVFAKDTDTGRAVLLHRGNIGGGRPGVGRKAFWQRWDGHAVDVFEDDTLTRCVLVACLDDEDLPDQIAKFVHQIAQIKTAIVG